MSEALTSFALVAGIVAVVVPTVAAFVNVGRLFRARGDHLVVRVGREEFVIDFQSLDQTDLETIDSATRAVEKKARLAA